VGAVLTAVPPKPQRVVLYDDDCAFCKWSLDKILAWDRRHRLRPVAIQSDEGQGLLANVPESERLDSWHLVLPSGEVRSAGAAAAPLAELLPAGRPLAFLLRSFPNLTDRAYRRVAANRNRFARWLGIDASCELRR
jgi:predicted DCC family thiol-disulfide oxidoreductase YuxK